MPSGYEPGSIEEAKPKEQLPVDAALKASKYCLCMWGVHVKALLYARRIPPSRDLLGGIEVHRGGQCGRHSVVVFAYGPCIEGFNGPRVQRRPNGLSHGGCGVNKLPHESLGVWGSGEEGEG